MDNFNLEKVGEIIRPLREAGKPGHFIAAQLKKAGLITKTGKPWSESMVSQLAIHDLKLGRKKNTKAGPVGSSIRSSQRKSPVTLTATPNIKLIEEVVTSNLSPKLKLKLIASLTKGLE